MAMQRVAKRTRRADRTGSIPKAKKEQSGRKRGAKVLRKASLAKKSVSPSAPRVKGQRPSGIVDHGRGVMGLRGDTHEGAMGRRKRRQHGKPKPLL